MLGKSVRLRRITAADGTSIAYRVFGTPSSSAPSVVLSNGMGCCDLFWRHIVDTLEPTHRIVAWDYRAHGASERARSGGYAIETHADDLARVVDDVRREGEPAPLHIGFSMGVQVLLALYARRPELVGAMAFVSGPAGPPLSSRPPLSLPGALPVTRAFMRALRPAVPHLARVSNAGFRSRIAYPVARALGLLMREAPRDDVELYLRLMTDIDPLAIWDIVRALMAFDGRHMLPSITVPVHLSIAGRDVFVTPDEMAAMHAAIPDAECSVVHEVGHAALLEAGPRIAATLAAFARRVGEQSGPGAAQGDAPAGRAPLPRRTAVDATGAAAAS